MSVDASLQTKVADKLRLRAGDALVVVDVQKDFLPGGSLAVNGGDDVIPTINAYVEAFQALHLPVVFTRDWHPADHCSFRASGGPWPAHCVRDSEGASWGQGLRVPVEANIISKGMRQEVDAYSGFSGTSLAELLNDLHAQRVFIGGLATDYCVRATAIDACAAGFETVVLRDAIRAVNASSGDGEKALREMIEHGACVREGIAA
jgi:nicotinamidase/pyrazinamidase